MKYSEAIISECGQYRYRLRRGLGDLMPVCMLNPSKADAEVNDPTVVRLLGFAAGFGYEGVDIANLHAYRSPDPKDLTRVRDPYGPENEAHLAEFCRKYGNKIVAAWGAHATPAAVNRFATTWHANASDPSSNYLLCLGKNNNGSPKHPLYLPRTTQLQLFYLPNPSENQR